MKRLLLASALLLAAPALADPLTPDEAAFRAHVAFLAADSMRGREAGSPEYAIAADYVAARLAAAGVEPAGDRRGRETGWMQVVPLVSARATREPTMALSVAGRSQPMVFGTDWTIRTTAGAGEAVDVTAPVVFAGYGAVDRANGRDDYRGLDVRGKIVAMLYSGPKGLNSEVAAHLGNRIDRARLAKARGAVGVIYLETTQISQVLPFARMARGWDARGMTWAAPDGTPRDSGAPALGVVSFAGAAKLFAGSRISWAQVRAADDAGRPLPTGPLAATLTTAQRYTVERLSSANVVGVIEGADPRLKNEYVVLTAHLDHIGVSTAPGNGDAINNGAMDNAAGIAAMLEVARAFQASGERPRRSVLFVAVTAEEKGLIGSDYYATRPTVPAGSIVANVNLDMPILTYRFRDLVAYGAERSTIGTVAAAAAQARGLALTPDPDPGQASFVRTDHYSFVRQGVPSISLEPGPAGPGKAATETFLERNYHQPSDEVGQPFDWTAARTFVGINYDIARALANAAERARWVDRDYFGTLYAPAPTRRR